MIDPVTIVIPGEPQGKARPRFNGTSGAFTDRKTRAYETTIGMLANASMRGRKPLEGPLHMDMKAVMAIPKSWSRKKQDQAILGEIRPTSTPDVDNIVKAISDGMNKIVYADDAAIVSVRATKVYGQQPFVVATIRPVEPPHRVPSMIDRPFGMPL